MLAVMIMSDTKLPDMPDLPEDDISDEELEAIAEGMLKDVLAKEEQALKKLNSERVRAIKEAGKYFAENRSQRG